MDHATVGTTTSSHGVEKLPGPGVTLLLRYRNSLRWTAACHHPSIRQDVTAYVLLATTTSLPHRCPPAHRRKACRAHRRTWTYACARLPASMTRGVTGLTAAPGGQRVPRSEVRREGPVGIWFTVQFSTRGSPKLTLDLSELISELRSCVDRIGHARFRVAYRVSLVLTEYRFGSGSEIQTVKRSSNEPGRRHHPLDQARG